MRPAQLKIRDVEIWRLEGGYQAPEGANRQYQIRPLFVWDDQRPAEYREPADAPMRPRRTVARYLKITTEEGLEGLYGPVDAEAAVVVDRQLREFLIGKEALAVETIWDQLHRVNRHSRSSHYMMAISAVDNALWDLRGRYYDTPVYRLLGGGPSRRKVRVYGSCLGYSLEPELLRRKCVELKGKGFMHQKWFMGWGPGDGAAGLAKNIAMVRNLREALGDDVDIMFDAYMGWDLNYALGWAKAVEQYRPRWIEEAFHVDKLESFAELSRSTSIPVATGEHFYGRWEVMRFLRAGAIQVVQSDPEWCGGVSELLKMAALCSAFDAHLIPHGHNVHAAAHVVASRSPMTCPLVELLIGKMAHYYHFDKHPPQPVHGMIDLGDRPGFGMELDDAKIEKRERVRFG